MTIPSPLKKNEIVKSKRLQVDEHLTVQEITAFMNKHGFGEKEFSEFLGVTPQAVTLWLSGQRAFSVTNSRLIRILNKYPSLIREF